jgi:hypothetical protein
MGKRRFLVVAAVAILFTWSPGLAQTTAPDWGGSWTAGPDTTFQFSRFDGGYSPETGLVYFMGGRLGDGTTDGSVWSFDPVSGVYTDTTIDLVTPISNYTMNLMQDGSGTWGFYVFGGRPAPGGAINSVQIYYPVANSAVQLGASDDYPGTGTCTSGINVVYNNKAYVTGGFDGVANYGETWVFDPTAAAGSRWSQLTSANLSPVRAYVMGAVVDDLIYAIGGNWFDGAALINVVTVEVLDPNSGTPAWSDAGAADLPEVCSSSRAWGFDTGSLYVDPDTTPLEAKIVSACGVWPDENEHVFVYDTVADSWEPFPWLTFDRRDQAGEFVPNSTPPAMWVWGGRKDSDAVFLTSAEYYGLDLVPVELMSFTVE